MRHDNDVNAVTTIRAKAAHFVRAHLSHPRRAAIAGLAAAVVGTGALALTAAPQPADAQTTTAAAASAPALHRADSATVTRSLDRTGKPITKPVTKPAKPAAKAAATAKTAAAANKAAKSVHAFAKAKELRVKYQAQPNYYWCGPA